MTKHQNIIGIDPDVDKSGVAFLHVPTRKLEATSLSFPDLLDYLQTAKTKSELSGESVIVVVEASWLISHHWQTKKGDNQRVTAMKGNSAGRNHEVGRKIVEMCEHYGLEVIEQRPLRKCWKGRDGKITADELNYILINGGSLPIKRSNQEERDAVLLAWNHAGLPIRVKPLVSKPKLNFTVK
ncbi:hypothetical protein DSECCO2_197470 [anaerobic digester metagenome]